MYAKRCAVQPALTDDGRPVIHRRVSAGLRRYLVLTGATVFFGNLSREITANVIVEGIDIDAMIGDLEAGRIVMATMEIDDGGEGDLPTIYRLTSSRADMRASRRQSVRC